MTEPAKKYFDLFDDLSVDQRWFLHGPAAPTGEELGEFFTSGRKYEGGTPVVVRAVAGTPLELTLTEDIVPIVNDRVAQIFSAHVGKDAQLVPASVLGTGEKLWAVNVLAIADCIDDARSSGVARWTAADGKPDLIGKYRTIDEYKIDPARAGNHAIFRPLGWNVALIISEPLGDALVRAGVRLTLRLVS